MQVVSDLHLHSKYSRAVSQQMILPQMCQWAVKKGINLLTTSDFTHPLWFREISNQLEEVSDGVYGLKINEVKFILTTEISSIYKEKGKLRRIHNLIFSPNLEIASKINKELLKRGCNLHADGRPIVGISSKNLLELILSINEKAMLIPCHVWTPHFGIYGSASGYDSLSEAFEEMDKYIYGIETGLSSDPEMNWQIEELKTRSILSFSDAHSLPKMGREATVFELEKPTYENIRKAIMRTEKSNKVLYTIEFYPEEGKYHFSGHRNCRVVFGPSEIKTKGDICPVCKRRLTEGVLYRLNQLSKEELLGRVEQKYNNFGLRWYTDNLKIHPPYVKLVPLNEIIAEGLEVPVGSEKIKVKFDEMCQEIGSEIDILLKISIEEISSKFGEKIAEGVSKVRRGDIVIDPGYDGEYGKVKIWSFDSAQDKSEEKIELEEAQLGLKF